MTFFRGLLLLGYYVVAVGLLWTVVTRDYAATRLRVAEASDPNGLAEAFLGRVARIVGVLAGGGVAALLVLIDPPLVSGWWVAPIAVLDAAVTWALVVVCLRVLRARFGLDVVAELRDTAL